jgi:hypothetical protein
MFSYFVILMKNCYLVIDLFSSNYIEIMLRLLKAQPNGIKTINVNGSPV